MKPEATAAKLIPWEILYDHYKDTFAHIRDREKQRNRAFFIVIALVGLLFLEVGYPANLAQLLGEVDASPIKLSLRAIPGPALLSATWTFLVVVVLQYCQTSVHIERQYKYLHVVEDTLSSDYGGVIFRREGKAYCDDYPLLTQWAWFFYTLMFPAIVIVAVFALIILEGAEVHEPRYYFWYNCIGALAILLSLTLYRFLPLLNKLRR